jgi:uncharacterized peroxidase-related enzyme
MPTFTQHTRESAPEAAKPLFDATQKKFGFTPNLIRVLAESPAAAEAYLTLTALLDQTSLDPIEQQVVLLSVSFENGCAYCMAAHSGVAKMVGASDELIEALRAGTDLPEAKLNALSRFTRSVVRERGWVSDNEVQILLDAGYPQATVFEVLLGVALKTLSNYTNHIADTEIDDAFQDFAWQQPSASKSPATA